MTDHERLAHSVRPLWTSIEETAPVEVIWMLELAALIALDPDKEDMTQ